MATAEILNGERVVVVLFIGLVLFSLPLSLLLHGVALSLLALSALFIEIRAEDDASSSSSLSLFKTRSQFEFCFSPVCFLRNRRKIPFTYFKFSIAFKN